MSNLKAIRKAKGLTQAEVAKHIGISQNNYSYWENGKVKIDNDSLKRLADFFNVSVDYILGIDDSLTRRRGVKIPVYGEIAAGLPIEAIEDIIDFEEITTELAASGEFLALSIKGDSMAPRIQNGDVVIIRRQENAESGDIAAVMVNGDSATLKRVKWDNNGLWLLPLNPAFDPIFYTKKECAEKPVRILGKMIELRAKF